MSTEQLRQPRLCTTGTVIKATHESTNTLDDNPEISSAFKHLRSKGIEGFRTEGYLPPDYSGVTIGAGVDLSHQTEDGLREKGVPESIVKKIIDSKFLGTHRTMVKKEGLMACSLKLTEDEAEALSKPFVVDQYKIAKPFAEKMSRRGLHVLISLRHWAGALGNRKGVLAPEGQNFVWEAIKHKTATDKDLKEALNKLVEIYGSGYKKNRLMNEIMHLEGKHP